jgi:hypothetical protein
VLRPLGGGTLRKSEGSGLRASITYVAYIDCLPRAVFEQRTDGMIRLVCL